jgi:hypothetical protein
MCTNQRAPKNLIGALFDVAGGCKNGIDWFFLDNILLL